jgi:hypothetical protein
MDVPGRSDIEVIDLTLDSDDNADMDDDGGGERFPAAISVTTSTHQNDISSRSVGEFAQTESLLTTY